MPSQARVSMTAIEITYTYNFVRWILPPIFQGVVFTGVETAGDFESFYELATVDLPGIFTCCHPRHNDSQYLREVVSNTCW